MKLTNGELWGLFNTTEEKSYYRRLIGVKWNGLLSFEIAKLGKKLNDCLAPVNDARLNIIGQMKEEGKDPSASSRLTGEETKEVKEKAEAEYKEFFTAFMEILNKEEEVDIRKIKVAKDKIPDIEPEVLLAFDKFIEVV